MHLRIIAHFGSIQLHLLKLGKLALQNRSLKRMRNWRKKREIFIVSKEDFIFQI